MSKAKKANDDTELLSSLREEIKSLRASLTEYQAATLRSRTAVYRLLVTRGNRVGDDWYRKTAEECGLAEDASGNFIIDSDLRSMA